MAFIQTTDGTEIFYRDWGIGRPIVLIHGWPVNADMWEYQAPFLAERGFRVITYDRRGFGRSGQPFGGYDYDTMADDLHGLLTALDLHGVTLVGFSMGGGEVARYLSRHGDARVAKAALVASVLPFLLKTETNPEGVDHSVFDKMTDAMKTDRPAFMASFAKQFYGAGLLNFSVSSELLQWTASLALQASPKATLACAKAFATTDFRADMKAFTIPTLIIHGLSDQTVPFEVSAQRVAAMLPHAHLETYEGAPHGLYFTQQDRLNADLLAFAGS